MGRVKEGWKEVEKEGGVGRKEKGKEGGDRKERGWRSAPYLSILATPQTITTNIFEDCWRTKCKKSVKSHLPSV